MCIKRTRNIKMKFFRCFFLLLLSSSSLYAQTSSVEGDQAYQDKNYRMAIVHYQRALKVTPDDVTLLNALAKSYEMKGQLDKAVQTAINAIAINDSSVDSLMIIARHEYRSGNYDSAIKNYKEVLNHEPQNKAAQVGLIETLIANGEEEKAIEVREEFENE